MLMPWCPCPFGPSPVHRLRLQFHHIEYKTHCTHITIVQCPTDWLQTIYNDSTCWYLTSSFRAKRFYSISNERKIAFFVAISLFVIWEGAQPYPCRTMNKSGNYIKYDKWFVFLTSLCGIYLYFFYIFGFYFFGEMWANTPFLFKIWISAKVCRQADRKNVSLLSISWVFVFFCLCF